MNQAINAHQYTGTADLVLQAVNPVAVLVSLFDMHRLSVARELQECNSLWAKAFVLWAARSHDGFRHPREMGQTEVEGFLTMLATEKQVEPATHRQALNALLFLYRQVLGMELPWMQ